MIDQKQKQAAAKNKATNVGAMGALIIAAIALLQAAIGFGLAITDGNPQTVPDGEKLEIALLAVATAWIGWQARDAGKTSRDSGLE